MVINELSYYVAVRPMFELLTDEDQLKLKEKSAEVVFGVGGYYAMTIEQLGELFHNRPQNIFGSLDAATLRAFQGIAAEGVEEFLKRYINQLQALSVKPDIDEERAQSACMSVEPIEGLLVFARNYFGLPNFAVAAKTTLGDLLIAKKDMYNRYMYERALARIKTRKK